MSSTVDLDQIIALIQTEATRPEYQVGPDEPITPLTNITSPSTAHAATSPSAAAPINCVDDLLLIVDHDRFIDLAYRSLLGRPADAAGAAYYAKRLQSGYGQTFVLAALRASPEARARATPLPGFGLAPVVYLVWQITRRIGLESIGKLANRAYHAWRHLGLAASGRTLTHLESRRLAAEQRANDQIVRVENTLRALIPLASRCDQLDAQLAANTDNFDAIGARLDAVGARLDAQLNKLDQLQSDHLAAQTHLTNALAVQRASLTAMRLSLQPRQAPVTPQSGAPDLEDTIETQLDTYYLAFEEAHRGSEADIRSQLDEHLPLITALPERLIALPLLDLGCGRGEWLDVLSDMGLNATGIDLNAAMVARCRTRGLKVTQAEACSWLQALPSDSHAAITGFHIIEHLPFEVLYRMVEQAWRVLAPGGVILFETPNPENVLVGSHTFYHDFSHRNPVTPSAISFLLGYLGFDQVEIIRLHPYPENARVTEASQTAERLNGHLYGPQDFLVVARKPAAGAGAGE